MTGRLITRNIELEELVASRSYPELAASASELAPALVITLVRLAFVLQGFRDLLNAGAIYITSGYRTLELHAAIYAPKTAPRSSRHLRGTAADFELEELNAIVAFVRIATIGLEDIKRLPPFDRLCVYPLRGHIHVDIPADVTVAPARELYLDTGRGWERLTYAEAVELAA
jgi:hypothetical protein